MRVWRPRQKLPRHARLNSREKESKRGRRARGNDFSPPPFQHIHCIYTYIPWHTESIHEDERRRPTFSHEKDRVELNWRKKERRPRHESKNLLLSPPPPPRQSSSRPRADFIVVASEFLDLPELLRDIMRSGAGKKEKKKERKKGEGKKQERWNKKMWRWNELLSSNTV